SQNPTRLENAVAFRQKEGRLLGVVDVLEAMLGKNAARRGVGKRQLLATVIETIHPVGREGVGIDPAAPALIAATNIDQQIRPPEVAAGRVPGPEAQPRELQF